MKSINADSLFMYAKVGYSPEPKEFYRQFYRTVLKDLLKNKTCWFIESQINRIDRWEYMDPYGKDLYHINMVEWQVYQDLNEKIRKMNGKLPVLAEEEINCPDRLTAPSRDMFVTWDKLEDARRAWSCDKRTRNTIRETMTAIIHAARSAPPERDNNRTGIIPVRTKEDDEPERKNAEQLKDTREEADRILRQARKEAEEIRQRAADEAAQMRDEAKEDVARIHDEANKKKEQEAQQSAQELIRKYISSELNQNWAELRKTIETEDETREDDLVRGERERNEIWAQVSEMQGNMVKAMEEAVTHITRIKQDICQELGEWRSSLHVNQFDDITKAYAGLFRVHEEMNRLFSIAATSELPEESIKELSDGIRRVLDNLGRIERQMDRALSVFGMYPIHPEEGDSFDNERHELTDKQQDEGVYGGEGCRILRCVTPGVALRYNETDREDRILRRAKVEVDSLGRE